MTSCLSRLFVVETHLLLSQRKVATAYASPTLLDITRADSVGLKRCQHSFMFTAYIYSRDTSNVLGAARYRKKPQGMNRHRGRGFYNAANWERSFHHQHLSLRLALFGWHQNFPLFVWGLWSALEKSVCSMSCLPRYMR